MAIVATEMIGKFYFKLWRGCLFFKLNLVETSSVKRIVLFKGCHHPGGSFLLSSCHISYM